MPTSQTDTPEKELSDKVGADQIDREVEAGAKLTTTPDQKPPHRYTVWLHQHKRLVPPTILTLVGVLLVGWSSIKLVQIFSESDRDTLTNIVVSNDPACQTPSDLSLAIFLKEDGIHASVFPYFESDDEAKPHCIRIGAAQPIKIPAGLTEVWGDAEMSKPPQVLHVAPTPASALWFTRVYFPSPTKPDAQGWQPFPRNKAMTVLVSEDTNRPDYTSVLLNMAISTVPLLGPKSFIVLADKHLEFKSLESTGNNYSVRNGAINISLNRGLAIFKATFTDKARQRLKDILLAVASGLLVLGLGCLVDAAMKFGEIFTADRRERKALVE